MPILRNLTNLLLVLSASPAIADPSLAPARIDAFGTSDSNFTGIEHLQQVLPSVDISIHLIDGIERIESTLGAGLPASAGLAEKTALKRLQQLGVQEREALQNAADGLVLAWQYQLRRYPAVVVDRRWVVYGVTDLSTAYAFYEERRGEGDT